MKLKFHRGENRRLCLEFPPKQNYDSGQRIRTGIWAFINYVLCFSWLPLLIFSFAFCFGGGVHKFFSGAVFDYFELPNFVLYLMAVLSLLIALICHEIGHIIASLGCGGQILEIGILLTGFPAGYVMHDDYKIKSRMKRVQLSLAGSEANFFMTGILMLLGKVSRVTFLGGFSSIFLTAGLVNFFIGGLNLCLVQGLDGERAISLLLDRNSIAEDALNDVGILFNRRRRKKLLPGAGINGFARMCISVLIVSSYVLFPAVSVICLLFDIIRMGGLI